MVCGIMKSKVHRLFGIMSYLAVIYLQAPVSYPRYLKKLTKLQLMRMLMLIKDHLNGLTLAQSLERSKELDHIDPNEDLNKVRFHRSTHNTVNNRNSRLHIIILTDRPTRKHWTGRRQPWMKCSHNIRRSPQIQTFSMIFRLTLVQTMQWKLSTGVTMMMISDSEFWVLIFIQCNHLLSNKLKREYG